ncbi:MAG: FtsW/RodA/SpoVE family cell cycle protein [Hyphomonadaceae bacterium]|nr:FtsW/RodA/SpoVE family cell cycle protein [Hyphomonadaceae bacterium]
MNAALGSYARTLDRTLLGLVVLLMVIGLVCAMAASPGQAARINVDDAFRFAARQAVFAGFGLVLILGAAALSPLAVRRAGAILFVAALALVAFVAFFAPDVKGASRWIDFGPLALQPSELLKPAIVIVWAWMLSEEMKKPGFPGRWIATTLYCIAATFLLLQPDVGQTALLGATLLAMLLLSGVSWPFLAGGVVVAGVVGVALYFIEDHVRARVDAFLASEASYQVGRALDAISGGGVFGRGPGEGVIKRTLPDAHSDFVYAVAAEEFGLFASLGLIALFGFLAWRGLSRSSRLIDPFAQLAASGLFTLVALQAAIHIAVNLSLAPAKGMTLPFVSYGGSSMTGAALTLGLALALTRRRPGAHLYDGRQE